MAATQIHHDLGNGVAVDHQGGSVKVLLHTAKLYQSLHVTVAQRRCLQQMQILADQ